MCKKENVELKVLACAVGARFLEHNVNDELSRQSETRLKVCMMIAKIQDMLWECSLLGKAQSC